MPLVNSHHTNQDKNDPAVRNSEMTKVSSIVKRITFDILKENPEKVAEVEAGILDRSVLETEIIKNIDRNRYNADLSRGDLIDKIFDYMFGYGDLQMLVEDEDISDIDFTRYNYCTIKKNGKKQVYNISFAGEKDFEDYCKLIILRKGGIINENDSHCRISDSKYRLRINVCIYPRNITGPSLNIRKHRLKSYSIGDLVELGMINHEIAHFLQRLARTSARILFCGKGAAGKTTCLRAFINLYPELERVLVCESDSELYPDSPGCIVQKIKKANEGGRPVTLLDLVRDGLTMSVDTYVIGEIVSNESWTLISAGLTGHKIAATIHSDNAADVFDRLITLIKTSGIDLNDATVKRIIINSIDIIVFLKSYKVTEIFEVLKFEETGNSILTNPLFAK